MISYGIWGVVCPQTIPSQHSKIISQICVYHFGPTILRCSHCQFKGKHLGQPWFANGSSGWTPPPRPCQGPRSLKSSLAMPMSNEWSVQPEMPSVPAESFNWENLQGIFRHQFILEQKQYVFFSPFEVFLVLFGNESIDINWHCWASEKDLDLLRGTMKDSHNIPTRFHNCGTNQWGNAKECPTGPLLNRTHKKNP